MPRATLTCQCGRRTYGVECIGCKIKKKYGVRLPSKCIQCGKDTLISASHARDKKGVMCNECRSKFYSALMKKTRARETQAERIARSKYGRSCAQNKDWSSIVSKQWVTIKSNPILFNQIAEKKSAGMKKVWSNMPDDERNAKIKKCFIHGRRSKLAIQMKEMMEQVGLDGFLSEQAFCGFIPDEIDHKARVIVEFFGDYYHCKPSKYPCPDLFIKGINRTVGEQWQRDRRRLGCFYKQGYEVVIIWESDFRKDPHAQIDRIKIAVDHSITKT